MSLRAKYLNATEFSLYRFLIPELCGHVGKAIWLDSDMVCLADIGELFDTGLGRCRLPGEARRLFQQGGQSVGLECHAD